MRIYLASSWRNDVPFETMLRALLDAGHEVYNFKKPWGEQGFSWSDLDPHWKDWSIQQYIIALNSPAGQRGFKRDKEAIDWADALVMVYPCGSSAHLECGYAAGKGKKVAIFLAENKEADLMYGFADMIAEFPSEVIRWLDIIRKSPEYLYAMPPGACI